MIGAQSLIGLVFVAASVPKLLAPSAFARAIAQFGLLPSRFERPVARSLPLTELVVGVSLLTGVANIIGGVVAFLALVVFSIAAALRVARGHPIECGCFGSFSRDLVGWGMVVRNIVLAAVTAGLTITTALHEPAVSPAQRLATVGTATLAIVGLMIVADATRVLRLAREAQRA